MSVAKCQREVSSAEFGEWVAYASIEPFGSHMDDVRMGTIASVVANSQLSKNATPYKPIDFAPWAKEPEAPAEDMPAEAVAASLFGIDLAELKKSGKRKIVIHRPKP
jgi:hypothetical protein